MVRDRANQSLTSWLPCRCEIGFGEVVTLEQKWQAAALRERIRETVRKIEASRVTALPVLEKCLDCEGSLFGRYGDNFNSERLEPFFDAIKVSIRSATGNNHMRFDMGNYRHDRGVCAI